MIESRLEYLVSPLTEMTLNFVDIIKDYKRKETVSVAGLTCMMLPPEILVSFGLIPLKVPAFIGEDGCFSTQNLKDEILNEVYDFFIIPDLCCNNKFKTIKLKYHEFKSFSGYGKDASVELHNELDRLLISNGISEIKKIDIELLQKKQRNIIY